MAITASRESALLIQDANVPAPRNSTTEQTAPSGMKMLPATRTVRRTSCSLPRAVASATIFASAAGTPTVEIISIAVYTRYAALNMPNAGESLPPIMLSSGIWKNAPITLTSRLASIKINAP